MSSIEYQEVTGDDSLTFGAPTVEEALEKAARKLSRETDELEYEVVDEGSSGLFGLGARPARIRVLPPDVARQRQSLEVGKEVLEELLGRMGIEGKVTTYESLMDAGVANTLQVASPEASLLIGRQGQTLRDIEYMTRLIASRRLRHWPWVHVDVDGYRARRWRHLRTLATEAAEKVRYSAQPVPLPPMPPWERRIIHHTLQSDPDVTTRSLGRDAERHVVVWPRARSRPPSVATGR